MRSLATSLLVVLTLAACSASSGGAASDPPDPTDSGEASPGATQGTSPGLSLPTDAGVPIDLLQTVVADAAARASVEPGDVRISKAQPMSWSDGSLGCPQPDMFYTQAVVEGYWVVVEAGGQSWDYRSGSQRDFRLCEDPPESSDARNPRAF
jgi:hypothetical protein